MKKILSLALLGLALSGNAQQVNGDFDAPWETCYPWSSTTTNKAVGTQPVGWKVSNVYNTVKSSTVATETTDSDGKKAVLLTNQEVVGQKIPAYISLGTPWSTASVKGTTVQSGTADGGVWGGISFTYKPDAVQLKYKRALTTGSTERASVIAYLWKGTWTQTDVPANVAVGVFSPGTPKKVNMTDRDRNVLFNTSGVVGGAITSTEDATLIASKEYYITDATSEWTTLTIDLDYKSDETPEKLNIILSANDFFADRNGITAKNTLTVDNVKLLYYHSLKDVKYGSTDVVFDSNNKADLGTVAYNAETALTYTKVGMGATVEVGAYNSATCQQTITVKGNDYNASDASTYTVYTIQYAIPAAELASVKISGEDYTEFNAATTTYTLPYAYNPGIVIEGVAAEGGTIVTDESGETAFYDNEHKTITVKVKNSNNQITEYTFNFTDEVTTGSEVGTYQGSLSVILSAEGASMPSTLDNSNIVVTKNSNNTLNILLKDFTFKSMGVYVGDIFLSNVPVIDGKVNTKRTLRLTAFNEEGKPNTEAFGWGLGHLPIQIDGAILNATDKEFGASIDILTAESEILKDMFSNIHVDFVPMSITSNTEEKDDNGMGFNTRLTATGRVTKTAAKMLQINNSYTMEGFTFNNPMEYIDLSEAKIDEDVTGEDLMTGAPSENNTLIYLPASANVTGNNIICGSTCDNFTLTEGQAFDAPKAFTATKVTYDRKLSAGKVQTFVLPFSFTPGENDLVAALESVEGNVLTFKRIEGATVANKPYLIQTDNKDALASFDNVNIEQTTGDLTTTVNGVSHIGSYAELTVTDAYGYAGGQFVKAGKGTVKPFRTYITIPASSGAAPKAFDIHFADTETGIATVVTDSKDQNVYNLQGVRVAKSLNGLPKGIYIVNGKKTVIK
ncbi:MAG: calycin-like domain-containing protein [Bacteroidales bacterium]|nr:calycin-like domain-containing protein [Bacteroidales bacterium]